MGDRLMLVVHVEVWPGGDPRRKQHIGTMTLVNETSLSEHSGYEVHLDGEPLGKLVYHWRRDGAWKLVSLALNRHFRRRT